MRRSIDRESFLEQIRRGREFEERERSYWMDDEHKDAEFEAPIKWKGRRRRVDIGLGVEEEGYMVVELKATDWDRMLPRRVRLNALRHARQVWRYIEAELAQEENGIQQVHPALVYPVAPTIPGRKEEIERILNERDIQVVWRA